MPWCTAATTDYTDNTEELLASRLHHVRRDTDCLLRWGRVVIRRLLVLTAKLPQVLEKADALIFRQVSIELALLALMIVALVVSLVVLRRRPVEAVADRG